MNTRKLTALGALALAAAVGSSAHAGIKYWDNQDYKPYDADDYAPGAVWNYDGIRNAGLGQPRSTTAATWKNLGSSGANNDVWVRHLNQAGNGWANSGAPSSLDEVNGRDLGSWTENGFALTGDSEWRASGSGSTARIESGTNYTLQALVSGVGSSAARRSRQTATDSAIFPWARKTTTDTASAAIRAPADSLSAPSIPTGTTSASLRRRNSPGTASSTSAASSIAPPRFPRRTR